MKRLILQAVHNEDHLASARQIFGLAELQSAIISTAFITAGGLTLLEDVLTPIADRVRLFVGIRNGVTTVQGVQKALEIGCETYMVDTGTRTRIFHPKLYFAKGTEEAQILIGSANLTMGGMRTNIEASVMQSLDLANDAAFIKEIEDKLDAMIAEYPQHVIRAVDETQLAALQRSGRLIDERKARPPEPAGSSSDRDADAVPMMNLHTNRIVVPSAGPPPAPPMALAAPVARLRLEQVWESKGLTRRHLNIPTASGTNPTGSMLLGVGNWEGIDQRHYFRDDVFHALNWVRDTAPGKTHIERTQVQIRMIIKDVDYGLRTLELSHNTRTDTTSYAQHNSMTGLHWGTAKPLVAHEDLLDRVMRLYRDADDPTHFTLEID